MSDAVVMTVSERLKVAARLKKETPMTDTYNCPHCGTLAITGSPHHCSARLNAYRDRAREPLHPETIENEGAWCDNIGREVHMKEDHEPRNGKLVIRDGVLVIIGLSLALWVIIWALVVGVVYPTMALLKGFGFW